MTKATLSIQLSILLIFATLAGCGSNPTTITGVPYFTPQHDVKTIQVADHAFDSYKKIIVWPQDGPLTSLFEPEDAERHGDTLLLKVPDRLACVTFDITEAMEKARKSGVKPENLRLGIKFGKTTKAGAFGIRLLPPDITKEGLLQRGNTQRVTELDLYPQGATVVLPFSLFYEKGQDWSLPQGVWPTTLSISFGNNNRKSKHLNWQEYIIMYRTGFWREMEDTSWNYPGGVIPIHEIVILFPESKDGPDYSGTPADRKAEKPSQ
jgi:hypothetical protein